MRVNEWFMDGFKYLGHLNYWVEGPVPPKVREMLWAPLIFKDLNTLGGISEIFTEKWEWKLVIWPCLAWNASNVMSALHLW